MNINNFNEASRLVSNVSALEIKRFVLLFYMAIFV